MGPAFSFSWFLGGVHYTVMSVWYVFLFSILFLPALVRAEVIRNFHADIEIRENGDIFVEERILYDFENESRHGIFRDIPVRYKTPLGNRSVELDVESVARDGAPEPYDVSGGGTVNLKIGDPDAYVTGPHEYVISYTVAGALNFFDTRDELYWNVTGNSWQVPMEQVSAAVTLPAGDALSTVSDASCYVGPLGSSERCEVGVRGENTITFLGDRPLSLSEGLTIAVPLAKGVVVEPTLLGRMVKIVLDNIVLLVPVLVFLGMYRLWQRRGKDPLGRGTIIAEYEVPEQLSPLFSGALVNEKVDPRDITAGIIGLAERGVIKIERFENEGIIFTATDYRLHLLKPMSDLTDTLEQALVKLFFGETLAVGDTIELSVLKKDGSFVNRFEALKKDIYQALADRGWFEKNPSTIKTWYIVGAVALGIGSQFLSAFLGGLAVVAGIVSALIMLCFAFLMPKKTVRGAMVKEKLQGFETFLSVTEKDRLAFHNAPQKSPEQFMAFLPYAVAFGVEKKWAAQFKDVYLNPPSWYSSGVHAAVFSASDVSSDFSGFTSSMGSAVSHAMSGGSGSGGGGFSGGGGGGGGGGSW